jgi:phosphatidate cytidylyltransferase
MLKTRIITALLLVAGLALILFALPPRAAVLSFAAVAALAGWEWAA